MSHSQFHSIDLFILRHAWLNLWDKRMLLAESTRLLSLTIFRRKPTRLRRLGVTPAFVVVELLSIMWDRILKEFRKASFRFQTMSTYRGFFCRRFDTNHSFLLILRSSHKHTGDVRTYTVDSLRAPYASTFIRPVIHQYHNDTWSISDVARVTSRS